MEINTNLYFEAPVEEKQKIGTADVYINAKEIMNIDIMNSKKIERKTTKYYFKELIEKYTSGRKFAFY